MPKVSVVVPTYNVEQYLHQALDSLVNQTLSDIEVICVNDGSTDGSLDILNEYAAKDARFKVISKPNSGYGHSMNVGIDNATGEYIGILEPDDYVKSEMFETLYKIAKENDIDFVKADFCRFVENNGIEESVYNQIGESDPSLYNKVLDPAENLAIFRFIMNTWSGIYKRSFLNSNKIRHNETPGASYQDNGFWFQTFCLAQRVYFLDKPLYMNRRDNPNSSVHSKAKVYCVCEEYQFIKEFLEKNPELKKKFIDTYAFKMYHSYMFTYRRVGDEFKVEFLERFAGELRQAMANDELHQEAFGPGAWRVINRLMEDPIAYHIEAQTHNLRVEIRKLREESRELKSQVKNLKKIRSSSSYKIARAITFIPRKIKATFSGK